MPALRDRHGDIPVLVERLVLRLAERHQRVIDVIPTPVMDQLCAYEWPGNVRELENVLERALITAADRTLRLADTLAPQMVEAGPLAANVVLADVERAHIIRILQARSWRIEGTRGAAIALGLKPSTLRSRMRKLGIQRGAHDVPQELTPALEHPLLG